MSHDQAHATSDQIPDWLLPTFRTSLGNLDREGKFLHLSFRGLHHITISPEVLKALYETGNRDEIELNDKYSKRLIEAESDADWARNEINRDYPILHNHSTIVIWSILETFVEDFAVEWLCHNLGDWTTGAIDDLKVPIGKFRTLTPEDQARLIVQELSRKSTGGSGATFLSVILGELDLAPRIGDELKKAVHELHQVRNVLAHRGGVADQKLVDSCPWIGVEAGQLIVISHGIWAWYHLAARRYIERVLDSALIRLGFGGCECPGMDTVPLRPSIDLPQDDA